MRTIVTAALFLAPLAIARAQSTIPADVLRDWERSRKNVLAYVDAMPASATAFRPTPGVRTFAEQFDHIVTTNLEVAALTLKGLSKAPVLGDSSRYLHDKAALRAYAAATYDYVVAAIKAATPAQVERQSPLYGQPPQPASRWLALSLEHSVWTLGQVIPYLRLNKVTPPSYDIPF